MNRSIWAATVGFALCGTGAADTLATSIDDEPPVTIRLAQAPQPAPQGQPPPQPTPQQRVAMLKQWLAASQAQLRTYEWVETTVITKGGEEKSRKQNTVYYGADGKLQKVPAGNSAEGKSGPSGPLRKKVAEGKKEEMAEYMEKAGALMHSYVPPDPNRIQQLVNNGKLSVTPGQRVRLDFRDYLKSGDLLSVEIEAATNRLIGMAVSSYLDTPKDEVRMKIGMGVLPDGTLYVNRTTLDAVAKGIAVNVENTGHRHMTR